MHHWGRKNTSKNLKKSLRVCLVELKKVCILVDVLLITLIELYLRMLNNNYD